MEEIRGEKEEKGGGVVGLVCTSWEKKEKVADG